MDTATTQTEREPVTLADIRARTTLTIEETGRVFDLSRASAYEAARRGDFPTIRIGRRILVPVPALLRMLGAEPLAGPDDSESA